MHPPPMNCNAPHTLPTGYGALLNMCLHTIIVQCHACITHTHTHTHTHPHPHPHTHTPDECEEVEREAQTLVSIIEDIMGESIQQYF